MFATLQNCATPLSCKDDTTDPAHWRIGDALAVLLADTSVIQELQEDALDRVLTPTLLVWVGERGLRGGGSAPTSHYLRERHKDLDRFVGHEDLGFLPALDQP